MVEPKWQVAADPRCFGPFTDFPQDQYCGRWSSRQLLADGLPHAPSSSRGSYNPWISLHLLTGSPGLVTGRVCHWPALESLPRGPRTNTTGCWLGSTTEHHPISSTNGTPKRGLSKNQTLMGQIPCNGVSTFRSAHALWLCPILIGSQPEGQPTDVPTAFKTQ